MGGLLVLVAGGLLLRLMMLPQTILQTGIHILDPDSSYHLRRAGMILQNYPYIPNIDPYLGYPTGGECPWPPLYDFVLATLALPFGNSREILEIIAMVLPPLVGAAQIILVFLIGRHLWDRRAGLVAAGFMAILPVTINATAPGMVDHHGPMVLIETALVLAALKWARGGGYGAALATTLLLAAGILTFLGILLFLPLLGVWIFFQANGPHLRTEAGLSFIAAALALAAACVGRADMELVTLSWSHPLLLLWPGLLLLSRARWPGKPGFWLSMLAGGWAIISIPGLTTAVAWATRHETFMDIVAESRPLLSDGMGGYSLAHAASGLSLAFFLLPLAGLWLLARHRSPGGLLVAGWSLLYFFLALRQSRFALSVTPGLCLMAGWAAWRIMLWTRGRWPGRLAALGLATVILLPALQEDIGRGKALAHWAMTGRRSFSPRHIQQIQVISALKWLKEHSPPASDDAFGTARPRYGVLSGWGFGHPILYNAERPVLATNYGTYVNPDICREASTLLVRGCEEQSSPALDRLGIRYIVVTNRLVGSLEDHARLAGTTLPAEPGDRLARRLLARDGTGPQSGAVARARLIHEVEGQAVKIFEIVRGARLHGKGAPGAPVELRLRIRTPHSRQFVWWQTVRCGDDGRFHLILPYPTSTRVGGVETLGNYSLRIGDNVSFIPVSETAVMEGHILAAHQPAPCGDLPADER